MRKKVTIAACTLNQWALDFDGNRGRILESILEARELGATFRTGPELEICGYSCEDHFDEMDTFLHSWEVLLELLLAPLCTDILIDVGMPVMHKNVAYNCRVIFLNRKILLIRPKIYMCDDGNYRESRWFSGWKKIRQVEDYYLPKNVQEATGQTTVPIGDGVIMTKETCIGFELCEELWNAYSTYIPLALDGVEIICNASGSHCQVGKSLRLQKLICGATYKSGGCYVFCNLRGCDGQRLYFTGNTLISLNGEILAKSKDYILDEVEVTTVTVDLEDIRAYKNHWRSRSHLAADSPAYPRIAVDFSLSPDYDALLPPTVPIEPRQLSSEEEISLAPACYLWDYLRRSGQGGFFLALSGGLDSASVSVLVYSMCRLIVSSVQRGDVKVLSDIRKITGDCDYTPNDPKELCNRLCVTCYMATENSSSETKQRASALASSLGTYHLEVTIDSAVTAMLEIFSAATGMIPKFLSRGGCPRQNLALQNIQARLRMVLSYLFAQLMLWVRGRPGGLLVLGASNIDESLRGYMTKYDCSSADLNPIGGITKLDLRRFLDYAKKEFNLPILQDILNAQPSAELEPLNKGQITQTDEEDMGMTYAELNCYGRLRKCELCGPYSMFCKLLHMWAGDFTPKEIADKVKHFFRCYAINRHKMTVLTPSCHIASCGPEDNRFDHRPFLYRANWSWQFRAIDKLVDHQSNAKKKSPSISSASRRDKTRAAVAV